MNLLINSNNKRNKMRKEVRLEQIYLVNYLCLDIMEIESKIHQEN